MRPYEIVLLGATGFTGRLTARRLAQTEPDLKWAIAGRNAAKLEAIRAELAEIDPKLADLPLLIVDTADRPSIDAMVAQTQVVLSAVGPFMKYGLEVVEACVEAGTDYCDTTGEPPFVAHNVRTLHDRAVEKGVRIVSCCGFEAIPPDIGAWFTVQQLPREQPVSVKGYVRMRGKTSGGTWNTFVLGVSEAGTKKGSAKGLVYRGPDRRSFSDKTGAHRAPTGGYAVPLPMVDPMIVLRSGQLLGYGPRFSYGHYAHFRSLRWLVGGGVAVATIAVGSRVGPIRRWLQSRLPPGEGPTEEEMAKGWFKVRFIAKEGDREIETEVSGDSDPGYAFTAKMVACAAMTLARNRDQLDQVGVISPAAAMAAPLFERLKSAGMKFEVIRG